jgi:peptide/nickel transport system substrate-binding protein
VKQQHCHPAVARLTQASHNLLKPGRTGRQTRGPPGQGGTTAAVSRVVFLCCLAWLVTAGGAPAQMQGGILRQYRPDNPVSLSIHEESTVTSQRPGMPVFNNPVFNNLVPLDQHVARNSMNSIVPDLDKRWSWDEDGTKLTFQLHQGVKGHDGKPFASADVKCT